MTLMHVTEVLHSTSDYELPLRVGCATVDPRLIEPKDEQEHQEVEELVAFRCSTV